MTVGIYTCRDDCKNPSNVNLSKIVFYDWPTKQNFFTSTHNYKIAIIEFDYKTPTNFVDLVTEFLKCDLVLVYSIEVTTDIVDLIRKFDFSNFVFVINGILNFNLAFAKIISQIDWVTSTANFYLDPLRQLTHDKLKAFSPKPYMFDVVYGQPRFHRDFVRQRLSTYTDQFYQTPILYTKSGTLDRTCNFDLKSLWEDEIILSTNQDTECSYYGQIMKISQVMPFKIYNKTAYSLVCETNYSNQFSFFTEKIAKPIIAHRLFIVISGQHYLRNLRRLGFKTFDSILDETYDTIEDPETRWTMAVDQAISLSRQDQRLVLEKVIPIAMYNFDKLNNLFKKDSILYELELFLLEKGYYKI
jgi:hypothetical protein